MDAIWQNFCKLEKTILIPGSARRVPLVPYTFQPLNFSHILLESPVLVPGHSHWSKPHIPPEGERRSWLDTQNSHHLLNEITPQAFLSKKFDVIWTSFHYQKSCCWGVISTTNVVPFCVLVQYWLYALQSRHTQIQPHYSWLVTGYT